MEYNLGRVELADFADFRGFLGEIGFWQVEVAIDSWMVVGLGSMWPGIKTRLNG